MATAFKLTRGDSLVSGDVVIKLARGGSPVDLTGCTIKWLRRHQSGAAGIAQEETPMTAYGAAADGQVSPEYPSEVSAALEPGAHVCQVEVTDADGDVHTYDGILMMVGEGLVYPAPP